MNIDKEQLVSYIKKLNEPKVLLIGDLAIDEMVYGMQSVYLEKLQF